MIFITSTMRGGLASTILLISIPCKLLQPQMKLSRYNIRSFSTNSSFATRDCGLSHTVHRTHMLHSRIGRRVSKQHHTSTTTSQRPRRQCVREIRT